MIILYIAFSLLILVVIFLVVRNIIKQKKQNELNTTTIKNFFIKLIPTKRRIIQVYAALLYNANIRGFISGDIFTGVHKSVCLPGLNCYSCPGAIGACPLGSLQNALYESKTKLPTYVLGIILLYSIILGRTICGFLCPVGLLQELLYKIKTPKLKKSKFTRILSYFKYVLLIVLVIIVPLMYAFENIAIPAFCKYVCPAGTFEGAILSLVNPNNDIYFDTIKGLFTWKFMLLILFIVFAVFIFRFFCRFICPLGALYGLFNRLSILGIKVDKSKCNNCGACVATCKMDVKEVGDHECIQCGECRNVCSCHAIDWKVISKIIKEEPKEEKIIEENKVSEIEVKTKKISKKTFNIVVSILMAILLAVTLVTVNIKTEPTAETGNQIDDLCIDKTINLIGTDETFSVSNNIGKITVINFWYTGCGPCVAELPHFNKIYNEYREYLEVIAIHEAKDYVKDPEDVQAFIDENFTNFTIKFGYDEVDSPYYKTLGGKGAWPFTLIVDQEGIIRFIKHGGLSEADLRVQIEALINQK